MYNDERAGVGTVSTRLQSGSPASKDGTLARPKSVPTPARGNQKIQARPPFGLFLDNCLPLFTLIQELKFFLYHH